MRPNILLIHSDQHRADCLGCAGHPLQRTPHLDGLAAAGARFSQAFCPSPICSPSRASLLTGAWPVQHGCLSIPGTELYRPAKAEMPSWSRLLADAGYRLGWVGKYHQEVVGNPADHGWQEFVPEWQYETWRRKAGIPDLSRHERFWFGETDVHASARTSRLHWGCDRVLEILDRCRADGRPFCVRYDPSEPHLPCRPPPEYAERYQAQDVTPWGSFGADLSDRPWIQRQQQRTWKVADWTWSDWAPVVARYHAEIELLDHQVGRLLAWLEAQGLAESTLVIYSSDHGDLCGGHGMIDKHFIMYDEVMQVPLLLRWPGQIPSGGVCADPVCAQIDLAATILAAAGLARPPTVAGRDLIASARGDDPQPRRDIYASWSGGQFSSYTQRMLREPGWKYIWNACDVDELYDLLLDPHERVNASADPAYADELRRLRHRLVAWMESIGDIMLNPWTRQQLLLGLK
jgi:arylsulfatase A-like enzyme